MDLQFTKYKIYNLINIKYNLQYINTHPHYSYIFCYYFHSYFLHNLHIHNLYIHNINININNIYNFHV